ncbi:single-stranded DNA-binding protein [Serratia marcescens]|uniref:single-stranded DNA-binding protein n=1 Tax=Serratia sp. TSA_105.2 TaxID=3415660 RepID=UPI002938A82D|nr:single-stranded DNA-binding protein [Serratia marcescens]ELQ9437720.1 single-stranded DNA-binding protein [Serratia marcescens]ELT5558057.1 single-stranded DNA-binding protein [Serratia marcescens]
MTAHIAAHGRLVADVQTKTTSNGHSMALGRMAVPLPCHGAEEGQATFWLAVTAFGKQADFLAKHSKGDLISVSGTLNISQWTGGEGQTNTGYQVLADSVISARTVRSGGKRQSQ